MHRAPVANALSPVRIYAAYYDPFVGPDPATNDGRNQEYIVVRNYSSTSVKLTGWTLRDLARVSIPSSVYTFPAFTLKGGSRVRVHTGIGTNTATDLYWGLSYYVWGDDSDTATLKNASGTTVSTCSWLSTDTSPHYC